MSAAQKSIGPSTILFKAKVNGWVNQSRKVPQETGSPFWGYPQAITADEIKAARTSPDCIVQDFLYSDVGCLVAQGGTGKTTMLLMWSIHIVLGLPLFGREVKRKGPVLIITAEDSREILVARLRNIAQSMNLSEAQINKVMLGVRISDVSGESFKLTKIDISGVVVISHTVDAIIEESVKESLACIFIDPTVSFGVGENRVNDAEQALIVAARRINRALNCCVMYVHHTGKMNAREGSLDQYSGRGGSSLPDGSRIVMVLKALDAKEMIALADYELAPNEYGLILAIPKLSYSTPQKDTIIVRTGYSFKHIASVEKDADEIVKGLAEKVWHALQSELINERYHSKNSLESVATSFRMSQKEVRQGFNYLEADSRVELRKRPNAGEKSKGGAHNYYHPISKNIDLGSSDL